MHFCKVPFLTAEENRCYTDEERELVEAVAAFEDGANMGFLTLSSGLEGRLRYSGLRSRTSPTSCAPNSSTTEGTLGSVHGTPSRSGVRLCRGAEVDGRKDPVGPGLDPG